MIQNRFETSVNLSTDNINTPCTEMRQTLRDSSRSYSIIELCVMLDDIL